MDKYIVEIDGKNICSDSDGKSKLALSVKADNGYAVFCTEIPLTPYTEPDLEQVRKEAYEKGFDAGRMLNNGKYEKGINDAWEAARKIIRMPEVDLLNLFTECYSAVCTSLQVFLKYDASECIEKIRQYEQEKEEQIQVGDEVENTQTGVKFIVTHTWVNNRGEKGVSGFNYECSAFSTALDLVRKTGRHFPEIAAVLQKMKETNNGQHDPA